MELKGQQRIAAPRQKVWQSLNDPNVLKACIPGCESLTQDGDSAFDAVVRAKVGPVRAKFSGRVELSDIRPPESYRISGQGKGGAAGVAKGSAQVSLAEDGDATLLDYVVTADVGGKLAQDGSRLVQSTANKYASCHEYARGLLRAYYKYFLTGWQVHCRLCHRGIYRTIAGNPCSLFLRHS